jgi:LysR family transcriptional regulator, glycine cleavage system transcriptional activator
MRRSPNQPGYRQILPHHRPAALAREKVVLPYLVSKNLILLPGPPVLARWQYYLVYPAHRRLNPEAQAFVDWVLEEVR